MMVYTYVKMPLATFLAIIIAFVALTSIIAVMGFRLGTMGERIDILEERLNEIESEVAVAKEVFAQASEIRQYILRTVKTTPRQATEIAYQCIATGRIEGLDPMILAGQAICESDCHLNAVGALGERGPNQVLPATFRAWHDGDINDWRATFEAGARFLASCLRRFRGNLRLALAAYNCGPNRPPERILEISSRYADRILAHRRAIAAMAGEVSPQ